MINGIIVVDPWKENLTLSKIRRTKIATKFHRRYSFSRVFLGGSWIDLYAHWRNNVWGTCDEIFITKK